jgi:thiol-disulfide isomerase/thioredoxin
MVVAKFLAEVNDSSIRCNRLRRLRLETYKLLSLRWRSFLGQNRHSGARLFLVLPSSAMRMRASTLRRVLLGLSILVAACTLTASDTREPAPRFSAKTLSGEKFTNDSLKGKVVLLQFWATWCQYCRGEQEMVDDINKEFAPKGLVVLAIDVNESKKRVKKYLEENPRSCRIVLTEDTNLAAMFAAKSYPIYVAIDRDGNIAAEQRGAAGEGALRNLLSKAGLESEE